MAVLAAAGAGWLLWSRYADAALREGLELARADQRAGRFATARERFQDLAAKRPRRAELWLGLGDCELALGRVDAADAAWSHVSPDAPEFPRAAASRATHLINRGRYRPAEDALLAALARVEQGGIDPADERTMRRALSRLYRFEGRVDDVRRALRASWGVSDDRPGLLKELWHLDNSPQPIESWSRVLDKADTADDRVALGRAVVATLSGDYAAASGALARCFSARPKDPSAWRAALDLALASEDEPGVWRAAPWVGPDKLGPADPLAVRAWLLARRADQGAEREALRTLIAADPSRLAALDRLAALEARAGRRDEADALRRRKAALDNAKDRFRKVLLGGADLTAHAGDLARLSTELGRTWDAWAWSQLAAARDGTRNAKVPPPVTDTKGPETLADRLAALGVKPSAATVAGNVPALPPVTPPDFVDDAVPSGLAAFAFDNGRTPLQQLPETMSGGAAVLDYDGDGFLDVYAVQGGPLDGSGTGDRLFRNTGDGRFEDVTGKTGLAAFARGYGHGVTVGDYDNDGRPDVFITRLRTYALYHNTGGAFEDVTKSSGLAGTRDAPSSAAFGDLDGDGDLDLYVAHYMVWDPEHPTLCPNDKGGYFYCDPSQVAAAPDHVFRNDGGTFVDVTKDAGFTDPNGRGLGVVIVDLDDDGRADVFVANDGTANFLFLNQGGWRFTEVGHDAGVAGNAEGGYQASMGVACGDYDNDGRPDLLVTNFYGESSTLYQNLGKGLFADRNGASGIGAATRYLLGFGTAFIDYDDDGNLDLLTANGHVNDNRPFYPYAMPAQLLAGHGGRFVDVSSRAGGVWSVPRVGRGLAVGDLDNDGRTDAVLLAQNDPLSYLHNKTSGGRSVTLLLEGTASNRDAVGAVVTVTTPDGRRRVAPRFGGGSYQSAGDPRLHIGLGTADRAERVEVRWPSGKVETFTGLPAGGHHLREGDPAPAPLKGFRPGG